MIQTIDFQIKALLGVLTENRATHDYAIRPKAFIRWMHIFLFLVSLSASAVYSAGDTPVFNGHITSTANSGGNADDGDVRLSNLYSRLKTFTIELFLIMMVISGLLVATGHPKGAWSLFVGGICLFGFSWIILALAKTLGFISA